MTALRKSTRRFKQLKAEFHEQGQQLDAQGNTDANCWICKKRIDYTVKPGTTDKSHELDHYYPVSLYPDLQDDPAGFRHSHRKCNRERSNGQPKIGLGEPVADWWM